MVYIKILLVVVLISSIVWLIFVPVLDAALSVIASIFLVISAFAIESKKSKREIIGIVFATLILLLCYGTPITKRLSYYYNRNVLFCRTLKPGMSISEVSDILKEKGNVIIRMASGNNQYTHYSILFTDENAQNLYGGWTELIFMEGKYTVAYIQGFEWSETICNFSETSKSATATSKP